MNISLFDFIALLLSDLKEKAAGRYSGLRVRSYNPDEKYRVFIDEFIKSVKAACLRRGKNYYQNIITEGIPPDLYNMYIFDQTFRDNTDAVYLLAWNMAKYFLNEDNLLLASREAYNQAGFTNHSTGFNQLNSDQSVRETGYILLPDLGTFGDENKINKTTTRFEKIYLKGLIVLTSSDLRTRDGQQYEVRNVILKANSHLRRTPFDGILTLAVSPISDRWLLKSKWYTEVNEFNTEEYRFQIEGVTDEALITSRISKAYKAACAHHAHILMFPEMYGTKDLSVRADEIIENAAGREAPLIVMPSWWHERSNEAPVLDDALIPLYRQPKHSPFLYNDVKPELEDLENKDNTVYMLHLPKIGRICVCICKDFLMDSYRRMLCESLEASFILVPAFSPEVDHFKNCMDELKHSGTYGIFINCCAAQANKNGFYVPITDSCTVGEVTLTKSVINDTDPPFKLLKPKCRGKCGGPDTCCVFIIKITDNGKITAEHIYF